MADRRYIDFDAAIAESEEQPVVVHYKNRDWELFSSIPAKPVFKLLRLQAAAGGTDTLGHAEMVTFLTELVPAGVLEAWLDSGISINDMADLLRLVIDAYRDEENELGEAPSPATGPAVSSSTGQPSRPTSDASIESTSPKD